MGDKPDELVAAERVVVEAAIAWGKRNSQTDTDRAFVLATAVEILLRLRAAQASQGSGG